ncbi:ABC transporter transmembrane domain-containing protein [Rhodospirillaceae bacterium]|nr:ABC transporter transmembrane domain-containing protein [Alphaproteobacteria bacterium]MDC1441699.1 ABC transporter transmembrane domain-containing protein [Rhodospirillaceae bacterium]
MQPRDKQNIKEGKSISALKMVLPYITPYRLQLGGAAVALLFAAATVLAMGAGLRLLIDEGFAAGNPLLLDRAVIVLVAVVVLLAGASYARFYLISWVGERVVADLRVAVFNHVIGLNLGFFETRSTGEILSRISTDTTLVQTVVGSSVSIALRNLLLFFGGMVMLLITSPKLTGLVLLVIPFVVIPIIVLGRKVRILSRNSQDRVADLGSHVEEILSGIRIVQAFSHEILDKIKFTQRVETAFDTAIERVRKRALLTAVVIAFIFGAVAIVLWIGGRDVLAGNISPGELSAFVFYAIVVAGSTGALSEVIGELQRAAGAMDRLNELLLVTSNIPIPLEPKSLPKKVTGAIIFNKVNFYYPSRPDQLALNDFNLEIKSGETVAFVGPSGAGKTTVFQLLLRFYDPNHGTIKLEGVSLNQTDPKIVRRQIGLVPQDGVIFSDNVIENIRYGRPESTEKEIKLAAESANALEFIEKLPNGFETNLGEKGVQLSGGQRQRLAIARALLRDPAVLLLDEATSALDAESERFVQRALDKIMVGRTTLIIAHRLATVLRADRIIVMEEGRAIASGSHEQLLKSCPLYARLAQLQFDLNSTND